VTDKPVSIAGLLDAAVERIPLGGGYSGAAVQRLRMADGTSLVVKRISPASDLTMRGTNDPIGRAANLWVTGVMDRLPPIVDHTIVAVERDGPDGWLMAMRDVSDSLLPDDRPVERPASYRILQAAAAVHETFRGERVDGLCTLADRYALLSPAMAARERGDPNPLVDWVARGWEVFPEVVPGDVAAAVLALLDRPGLLAEQLERCGGMTLIHGDMWLENLGLWSDGRVVMLDWALAAHAPPAVDFACYLVGMGWRIAAPRERIIDDFRAIWGDRHDERALQLALIGSMVEYGWSRAYWLAASEDETWRSWARAELAWWVPVVRRALEVWSPI
jgi:hypothetical protein